ncbi:hypothetical protein [uncultured Psychrobacter sp.]
MTNTCCSYEEFGFDSIENRVLKHTLSFVRRYLNTQNILDQ